MRWPTLFARSSTRILLVRLFFTMPPGKKANTGGGSSNPVKKTAKGYKRPVSLSIGTEITSSSSSSSTRQNWVVGELLGHGGFGDVYVADTSRSKVSTSKSQYVVKVEPKDNGPLFVETKFFKFVAGEKLLNDFKKEKKLKHVGIPAYHDSGVFDYKKDQLRYLVIQRLGSGLDVEMRKLPANMRDRLPVPVLFELAPHLIDALNYIHSHGYTHGDIKENNIMLGWPKNDSAYLIDFGLTSRFIFDGTHREYKENPKQAHDGTLEYTSMDSHKGVSGSRRSDLQILGFCLCKLLYGRLPWSGVEQPPVVMAQKAKYMDKPAALLHDSASRGSDTEHCHELENYWKLIAALKYEDEPKYDKLRALFEPRSSRGLFSVEKNFSAVTRNSAPSTSKQRSASPPEKIAAGTSRQRQLPAPKASISSSSSSKRAQSSTPSDDSDLDLDETVKITSKSHINGRSSSTAITGRAARAAKRSKVQQSSEDNDDDAVHVVEAAEKKHARLVRDEPKTGHLRSDRRNRDEHADLDAIHETSESEQVDEFDADFVTGKSGKRPAMSKSKRLVKVPSNSNDLQQPVLMLPIYVPPPQKKRLQHYDAEVYAIPPLPRIARGSSLSAADERNAAKNPFSINKFSNTAINGGSSSQKPLSSFATAAARGASSSQSNVVSGPKSVHKRLMHYDHEVTVLLSEDEDSATSGNYIGKKR